MSRVVEPVPGEPPPCYCYISAKSFLKQRDSDNQRELRLISLNIKSEEMVAIRPNVNGSQSNKRTNPVHLINWTQ